MQISVQFTVKTANQTHSARLDLQPGSFKCHDKQNRKVDEHKILESLKISPITLG